MSESKIKVLKVPLPKAKCLREKCGHIWTPRLSTVRFCPLCHTTKITLLTKAEEKLEGKDK